MDASVIGKVAREVNVEAALQSLAGKRLLITGAGGFCGKQALRFFAAAGVDVVAVVRPGARLPLDGLEVFQYDCDLTDRASVMTMLAQTKPEYVLHLAGSNAVGPSWQQPIRYVENNMLATLYLLDGLRELQLPARTVVAGSMLRFELPRRLERARPPHPYSFSKALQVLVAQGWAELYGMQVVVAEPSNLIGPGGSAGLCGLLARYTAAAEAAAQPTPVFTLSSAHEERDFLDVRDAIRAYALLLSKGEAGEVYPVTSGRLVRLGELASQFVSMASVPLNLQVGNSSAPSPVLQRSDKLQKLGWQPLFSLKASVADALEECRWEHNPGGSFV